MCDFNNNSQYFGEIIRTVLNFKLQSSTQVHTFEV